MGFVEIELIIIILMSHHPFYKVLSERTFPCQHLLQGIFFVFLTDFADEARTFIRANLGITILSVFCIAQADIAFQ